MSRFGGFKSANKKVKNATKTVVEGISYDSRLEAYMAGLLAQMKIPFQTKTRIVLQAGFRYNGAAIREIAIVPDFIIQLPNKYIVADTKGFQGDKSKLQHKLLKRWLVDNHPNSEVYLPSNKQECQKVVNIILKELCDSKQNT